MKYLLIKDVTICDYKTTAKADVRIKNDVIFEIGENLSPMQGEDVVNASGKTLMPAFIDLHCHFRDPGFTYKEDLQTGSKAAAAGGYTLVNLMANTNPICSEYAQALDVVNRAKQIGVCDVHQTVSITKNFDGETLSHLDTLPPQIKVISDDGKGVTSNHIMAQAMQIAKQKGFIISSHAEDMTISKYDYRLAEDIETARNILLAQYYDARLHMAHVSTQNSMQYIINAKNQNAKITCEVGPHHLYFYDKDYRVNPPIREKQDVEFLINAIKDGYVDCIATDHAPHTEQDKQNGAPGMVGLETAFGACYKTLCVQNNVSLNSLSKMLSKNPADILGVEQGEIAVGKKANLVLVDTNEKWVVQAEKLNSKSTNTAFEGEQLQGKVLLTIKQGEITFKGEF